MTSPLRSGPNTYNAGLEFNYAVWGENADIYLCNVPLNSSYRDIVSPDFDMNAYIDNLSGLQIENMSYLKAFEPIRINTPFNAASNYNYVRVRNQAQPIAGDTPNTYYYFIKQVKYISPETTELTLQLDLWSTWKNHVTFGNSFVQQGHIGIANENHLTNYGRDFLTHPEGLDTGKDYRVIATASNNLMTNDDDGYDILVVTVINWFETSFGTIDAPILRAAISSTVQGLTEAGEWIVLRPAAYRDLLRLLSSFSWISQGIVSITLIPRISRYKPDFEYDHAEAIIGDGANTPAIPTTIPYAYLDATASVDTTNLKTSYSMMPNWRDTILDFLPPKYRKLGKFLTAPYLQIEMTAWHATPIVINPENWANDDANVAEMVSIVPPYQQAVFMPQGYNSKIDYDIADNYDDGGEYLDFATRVTDFPTMSVLNNSAQLFLATNANQIAYATNYAPDWSQQRALMSAQNANQNAYVGTAANRNITNSNNDALIAQMNNAAGNNVAQSLLTSGQGIISSDPIGGISAGVFNTARLGFDVNAQSTSATIAAGQATRNTNIGNSANEQIADSNYDLAKQVAQGDALNQMYSIGAKVRDSQVVQPTTSGQIGGNAFNLIYGAMQIALRFKFIDQVHVHFIGDIWLRYGYVINQRINVLPPNLMVMSKFTYWKISETYINSSPMPEIFKQGIEGIFKNGTTVWADPAYIGNTDMGDNAINEGVVLPQ